MVDNTERCGNATAVGKPDDIMRNTAAFIKIHIALRQVLEAALPWDKFSLSLPA